MPDIDPIQLELMRNLFEAAAEEMGITLQRVAFSANIKERRDFSCAVFDASGQLLAQAAHIPVHLGSMPASVACECLETTCCTCVHVDTTRAPDCLGPVASDSTDCEDLCMARLGADFLDSSFFTKAGTTFFCGGSLCVETCP